LDNTIFVITTNCYRFKLRNLFSMSHPVNDEILDRLREEGEALGYTGEVLEKWIWMKFHQLPEGEQ